jgi:hypothetical protein
MDSYYVARHEANPDECSVCYLEPGASGSGLGNVKKPNSIRPGLSFEHADAAEDKLYWVVRSKRARKPASEIEGLSKVPAWAQHFKLDAKRLTSGPSEALRSETAAWFTNPAYESAWFEISGNGNGLGFHFAVMVYIGNHLRWVAGPRMDRMHLVAQIESKPSICQHWPRKN